MIKESGIYKNYEAVDQQSELKPYQKKTGPCQKNKRKVDNRIEGIFGSATYWLLNTNLLKSGLVAKRKKGYKADRERMINNYDLLYI